MRSMRPARLVVAIFAALAMTVFVSARAAFSQDADDYAAGADASWERTGPAIDEDAETADKVLEIPQVACAKDAVSVTCGGTDEDGNDDAQSVNAPSPGAPPTLDDDTANAAWPNQGWGTLDDYQNEPAYGIPYGMSPYGMTVAVQTMNRSLAPVPASAYVPMSSPLTQAARPPLNPGPWMTPPSMSAFSRPAGSPMMGLAMSPTSFGFHR